MHNRWRSDKLGVKSGKEYLLVAREKILEQEERLSEATAARVPSGPLIDQIKRELRKAQLAYDQVYDAVRDELGKTG